MSASVPDIAGSALTEIDRLIESARGGHIGAATLVDRLHTQQRAIAAAAAVVAGESFSVALVALEARPRLDGPLSRLTDEFASYRQAVHEALQSSA